MPPTPRALLEFGDSAAATSLERFKIYSFNILSDQACTPRLYGYSPSAALSWEYRKEQILQEIQTQDADIVCLQEIDTDTFKEYFSMKLAYADYKGVFWPRSRAKTMSEKDAKTVDGCATFYKGSKFILLDKQIIEFANIAINRADMKNQHDTFNRIMPRDHIGVVTFLENRQTGSRVMVVNTHIFWDPVYTDVKLIQSAILMESVNKWAEKYAKWPACKDKKHYALANESDGETPDEPVPEPAPSKEYSSNIQIPLVICSDLNSTADSSVYELFSKGSVKPDHKELGTYKYGNFTKNGMEHPFQLRSAYTNLDKTPDALEFTNYTPGFRGVIDHIWYSTNALENTSLLGPVDPEYMKTVPGFPNYHFPSDHLSLMAEFQFKGRKEKKSHPDPDFGPSSRSQRRND
jgi:CCR4-NOT transcription complex subunit 6